VQATPPVAPETAPTAPAPARRKGDAKLVDDLAGFVKYLTHHHGADFFETVGELDLSFSQVRALAILARDVDQASLKELGDRLRLSLPAVSRSVEGLVQRGYVTRAEDTADRRVKQVAATPQGRELVERLGELKLAGIADFIRTLDGDQRKRLAGALAPLVAREEIGAMRPSRRAR
jgi:DNA-binding MarR family transcriptional regulator